LGDITPTTIRGKILFIFLIVFGLALFGYFISQVSSLWSKEKAAKISIDMISEGKLDIIEYRVGKRLLRGILYQFIGETVLRSQRRVTT